MLTADLICHGVPSPLLFKRYISKLNNKYGENIIDYNVRYKGKNGWGYEDKIKTKTNRKTSNISFNPYMKAFLGNYVLRESCYMCKYAEPNRIADITLGDFWGVDNMHPDFFDKRGVSIVLVNQQKGIKFLENISDKFELIESSYNQATSYETRNVNLIRPSVRPKIRDVAYNNIKNENINIFRGTAYKLNKYECIKACIKQICPQFVINFYKTLKGRIKS